MYNSWLFQRWSGIRLSPYMLEEGPLNTSVAVIVWQVVANQDTTSRQLGAMRAEIIALQQELMQYRMVSSSLSLLWQILLIKLCICALQ